MFNIEYFVKKYLEDNRGEKKVNDLVYSCLFKLAELDIFEPISSALMRTYDSSTDSIKGNLYESALKKYIDSDLRFVCLEEFKKKSITISLPKRVCEEVSNIVSKSQRNNLKDYKTLIYTLKYLHNLVNTVPQIDMRCFGSQFDLVFKERNNCHYYFYEIKSGDRQDKKSDRGTLESVFLNYCYIIQKYHITDFNDISVGIIFMECNEYFNSKYIAMGENGGITFKEFCEKFYDFNMYKYFMNSINKAIYIDKSDMQLYFEKVEKVFMQYFKGKSFTKKQLISAIENTSYRV